MKTRLLIFHTVVFVVCFFSNISAQELIWLGTNEGLGSWATSISDNGLVVAGTYVNQSGQNRAFRWQNGVMQDLGTLGGIESLAFGLSSDGAVVVGRSRISNGQYRPFRWSNSTGIENLGSIGGSYSSASSVSSDGSVIVGDALTSNFLVRAFYWTSTSGITEIGLLPGGNSAGASDISSEASTIVGIAGNSSGQSRAFSWTSTSGMVDLGILSGGSESGANAVNNSGSVVVGWSATDGGTEVRAFRWENNTMQNLGALGGDVSIANAVSGDGSVIVGRFRNNDEYAFVWTPGTGMLDLNQVYSNLLSTGSYLKEAFAVSSDGRFIAGEGWNNDTERAEAFLLDTEFIVPIELTSFSASLINGSVTLKWQTATEVNNSGFEIERSVISNGVRNLKWGNIGFVNGKGTTTENQFYSFIDTPNKFGTYSYRLKQIDFDGSFNYSSEIEVDFIIPDEFVLEQNYPNPFNPNTKISWQSPVGSHQVLKVFDVLGNEIATLVDKYKQAGKYEVEFNVAQVSRLELASGIYFYQLRSGDYTAVKKMILIK